jgi:hypothetical protein
MSNDICLCPMVDKGGVASVTGVGLRRYHGREWRGIFALHTYILHSIA